MAARSNEALILEKPALKLYLASPPTPPLGRPLLPLCLCVCAFVSAGVSFTLLLLCFWCLVPAIRAQGGVRGNRQEQVFRGALIGSQQINRRLLQPGPVTGIDFWQRELPHGLFIFDTTPLLPLHARTVDGF